MKRFFAILLALLLCLSVVGCGSAAPEPTPEVSAEPTPTPEPVGIELWKQNLLRRYNMEYESFGEYWGLLCDGYFAKAPETMLSVLTFPEKEAEIREKRSAFQSKYGKSARYEIVSAAETELDKKLRTDFAAELEGLYEKAQLFLAECAAWDNAAWQSFAEQHGCTVPQAKELAAAYGDIAEACHGKTVEKAVSCELELKFSNGTRRTESMRLYIIDGFYVSEQLIDSAELLLDLVY